MIASTPSLWQSWLTVGGSIVGAVVTLTLLSKAPGARVIFRLLVADPIGRWMDERMDRKIQEAVGLQADVIQADIRARIHENVAVAIEPLKESIDQVNNAVNNVGTGQPPMKDRVASLEIGQVGIKATVDTIAHMVESLVRRK